MSFTYLVFKLTVYVSERKTCLSGLQAGFSLQFFLWESLELLQPKVKGPEENSRGPTVVIEQRIRTKIRAVLYEKF